MDTLPVEVLRIICSKLDFEAAANVRFLTHKLADIGAEFLITRVCFHTSKSSLARLERISNHPIFSRTIKVLVYEAPLLADIKCRHEYARHFEHDHYALESPREPPENSTERARRLFKRNKTKWTKEIYKKYDKHRTLFDAQHSLFQKNTLEQVLARSVPKFPKLNTIEIDPIRRCTHRTSARFVEEFGADCASPLSGSFNRTSDQLQWMLLPNNHGIGVITSLRRLNVRAISPSFFKDSHRDLLKLAFSGLVELELTLKLADHDIQNGENPRDCFHRQLSNGVLRDTVAAAKKLQSLLIHIDTSLPIYVDASKIVSTSTWPLLKSLSLATVETTQVEFLQILKRQPKLDILSVTLMRLSDGHWPDALQQMRDQLKLKVFTPIGFLVDTAEYWPMDLVSVSVYLDDHDMFELSDAIDSFVTDNDPFMYASAPSANPLVDSFDDFEEAEMMFEMYGTPSEIDEMSLDEDNLDGEDLDSDAHMLDFWGDSDFHDSDSMDQDF